MNRIEVKVALRHAWFPPGKFVSFFDYYQRVKNASEKNTEAQNIKKFFARQLAPIIPESESNRRQIKLLKEQLEDLRESIQTSQKKCCYCCFKHDFIFSRVD